MKTKTKHKHKRLTPAEEIALIQRKLGYVTYTVSEDQYVYIDLGDPNLNEIFGHRKRGIRIGTLVEVFGPESSGKTLIVTIIAAIIQMLNPRHTYVAKMDLENTNDDELNERLKIDMSKFYLFGARLATMIKDLKKAKGTGKEEKAVKQFEMSAELVCKEVETWIKFRREMDKKAQIILIVDSVTGMLVQEEDIDFDSANMRTKVSLASFLSRLTRKWVRMAKNYNVIIFFINQERTAPGVMFGNPNYTGGGRALKYYSAVRVRVRRVKSGKLKKSGKTIGIRSLLTNNKNKVGGHEWEDYAFRCDTRKTGKWAFISKQQAEKEAKSKSEDK